MPRANLPIGLYAYSNVFIDTKAHTGLFAYSNGFVEASYYCLHSQHQEQLLTARFSIYQHVNRNGL